MNIRVREFGGVKAEDLNPSADDLRLLAGEDYAGRTLSAEQVVVRNMLLCHDQYDRTYERFPKSYLERFTETLPGKSVLSGHDSGGYSGAGALPLARFFRAETETRNEEIPVPVRGRRVMRMGNYAASKSAEVVPNFEPRQMDVTFLRAGFYFPNDDAAKGLLNRIDLGVYRSVSIGFRYDDLNCDLCNASYLRSDCPHILGWELVDGPVVTCTYSGDAQRAEALEGSIVYLGAQPQARLLKQAQAGQVDPAALAMTPYGEDLVILKEAEAYAREFGHQRKSWAFHSMGKSFGQETRQGREEKMDREQLIKMLGLADTATDAEIVAAVKALADAQAEHGKALAAALGHTEAAKAPGVSVLVADAAALAKVGKTALEALKAKVMDLDHRLTGKTENAELALITEMCVEQRNFERLTELAEQKEAAFLEKFPAGKSGEAGQEKTAAADPLGDLAHSVI